MITRPLELSTRLRPPPKSYDYLFWVNGALIVLFFSLFGSRFVLSPGFGVAQNAELLPIVPSAVIGAVPTQLTLNIMENGDLYVEKGLVTLSMLSEWLESEAKRNPGATLLVRASSKTGLDSMTEIVNAANKAGFRVQIAANTAASTFGDAGKR